MIQQLEINAQGGLFAYLSAAGLYSNRHRTMSKSETSEPSYDPDAARAADGPPGRVLALDLGAKRIGVAISDELRLTVRPLPNIKHANWKQLLRDVLELCERFDVRHVVVGLPLKLDGTEGDAAIESRRVARNLSLALPAPVSLQDERHTSYDAEGRLRADKKSRSEVARRVDGEAAALILSDYLSREHDIT